MKFDPPLSPTQIGDELGSSNWGKGTASFHMTPPHTLTPWYDLNHQFKTFLFDPLPTEVKLVALGDKAFLVVTPLACGILS